MDPSAVTMRRAPGLLILEKRCHETITVCENGYVRPLCNKTAPASVICLKSPPGQTMPMTKKTILLIEDEQDLANLLYLHLASCCDKVVVARNGPEGLRLARQGRWDLIILDLGLPGIDGLEICRRLRREDQYVPVLMLTAKTTEQDRIHGLQLGADDYVTKPFSIQELIARINAIFRRCEAMSRNQEPRRHDVLEHRDLRVDIDARQVSMNGETVALTAREFDLLAHFVQHPERVYTRSQLLDQVWGIGHQGYEHTVNSHINRLRSKIEQNPAKPDHIVTVWGVGYRLG
jgi:DNA-binding response OmpR family regulator